MLLGVQEITVKTGMQDFERSFFQEMFLGHWLPNIHNNISKNTKRRKKKRWSGNQWLWSMLLECFLDGSMSKSHCFIIIHISVTSLPQTSGGIKSKEKSSERQMEVWAYKHGNKHDVIYQQHEIYRVREKTENPTKSYVNLKSLYCFLWRGSIGSLWLDREDEEALYKFINTHKQKANTFWLEQLHKIETVKEHFLQFSMIKLKFKVVTTLTPVY